MDHEAGPDSRYVYRSAQASLLLPLYRRLLWNRLLARMPVGFSPNAMTVVSTLCCAASFVAAALGRHNRLWLLAAAALVFAYLTLDNLDGAQARRTGRSSHLGEFADHWLDTLNNGFVVLGACLAAGLPDRLILLVLSAATLAFFAVQWELWHTGVFRMGRVGDVEGNTAVALLYVAIAVMGSDALQARPLAALPSAAVLLGCGVMAQALWTLGSAVSHVRERRGEFAPILLAHAALFAWASWGDVRPELYLAIAFLLNPVFTSRPVCGRLLGRHGALLDWLAVTGLVAAAASQAGATTPGWSANAQASMLLAGLALLATRHLLATLAQLAREIREGPGGTTLSPEGR